MKDKQDTYKQAYLDLSEAIDSSIASYELNVDGIYIKANDEFLHILKKDLKDVLGQKQNKFADKDFYIGEEYQMMWENFEGGLPYNIEVKYNLEDKVICLNESYSPVIKDDKLEKIIVLAIDITDSKRMQLKVQEQNNEMQTTEEELRQNFEELQATQENLSEREAELRNTFTAIDNSFGMFEMNTEGQIIKTNPEYTDFIKQEEKNILSKKHLDIIDIKEIDRNEYEMMWENFIGGLSYSLEVNYKHNENSIWLHESYTPILKDGKIEKILVFVIDISDSKHQSIKLLSLNEEMTAQDEELRQNMEELHVIQDNLNERETQLRSTLDAINNTMGSFEMDLDSKIIVANKTFLNLLELQEEETIGMKHILMISLEHIDKDEYIMMWENFEGGLPYEMDVLYKTNEGDVWLHESYTPIINKEEGYDKILVLVMDITVAKKQQIELTKNSKELTKNFSELKNIQDTLESKEAELTSTIDAIGFSTYIAEYALDGKILEMNDAYLKLFKRQEKLMIGKNIREFSNLKDNKFEIFWSKIISGVIEKNIFDIEHDDKKFWLSEIYAPILDKDNKPNKILAIAFDITESEKHQMLLQKQSKELEQNNKELEKLSIIARKTNNAIFILDIFGTIEWVNQGFTKLFGYTLEELKKKGANTLRMSEDDEMEKNFYQCVNNGQSLNFESFFINKAGVKIWKQTNLTPIFDKSGKTVKVVGIDTDITKNKEAEKEILKQRDLLHKKNESITNSINYAKRIQDAILPSSSFFEKYFSEYFIYFKPRDVVSGDFYWSKKINKCLIFAAADCTGHGVPGAFVSMLGISILNEVVNRTEITQANQILEELRVQIKIMLKQTKQSSESKDGMDISICVLKDNILQFAGANNPLYIIRESENKIPEAEKKIKILPSEDANYTLIEYKADKQPIGIYIKERPFTNHTIIPCENDTIYLFSDGYIDQFDKSNKNKFMSKNFKKLLLSIADRTMLEQNQIIDKTYKEWKGNSTQLDDILVLGIKI